MQNSPRSPFDPVEFVIVLTLLLALGATGYAFISRGLYPHDCKEYDTCEDTYESK